MLWQRIEAGELTGLKLANQANFKQAHISNFLNRKRGISLEGMDRVLAVQHLSVLDLLDPAEGEFENVLLVDGQVAANEQIITNENVRDILKFKKSFLKRLRPNMASPRDDWRRFVLIKVDQRDGMSMYPRLLPGATVLIDRHYNSLQPYRKGEQNMYGVRKEGGSTVKYVELAGNNLILRPHNQAFAVDVVTMEEGKSFADYIVGRVCHVAIDT